MTRTNWFGKTTRMGEYINLEWGDYITQVSVNPIGLIENQNYLAPGFVDLQVNGFAGVDYNSGFTPLSEIARSIQVLFTCGVSRFYPTVITGGRDEMVAALSNLTRAKQILPEGIAIEGFHVEGPHISAEDGPRGAHPIQCVRKPDIEEYKRWQDATEGLVKLVTLAPEWPEAPSYIESLVKDGVVISIGHTGATRQQIQDAVSAGATLSTHLGNGAHAILPRHPNYIWEQLAEDRLTADFIVDGIHLSDSFLKVALRAKGLERSVLVTDASSPAGAAPGRYKLGEQEVDLTEDNRVVLAGQTRLAGSALRMDTGVSNLMRIGGLTLSEAITMATTNPAKVGKVTDRENGLVMGDRADIIEFAFDEDTKKITILKNYISGKLVYQSHS